MKKTSDEIGLLLKVALVTSPIIAIMLVTPVFLVIEPNIVHLEFIFPLVIFFVFSLFPIHGWKFHAIRILNILSINGIIYIISNYILLSQTKKKLDIENEQLKFANLEARFQVLQNQINPHFLFNSIGTAKSLIRKNPSIADEYLVKLSDFLRLGFNTQMDIITVKEELSLCEDYIALQKMRFGDALQFEVNNAVKHNSMTEEEPLRIIITDDTHDQLIIENKTRKKFLLETSSKKGIACFLTNPYGLKKDTICSG
ncbi:histidine kinase-domain-containing protein [Russula earlei]|uniref:Histidine kinase-domain-containing protein n=1 Tax=Russula earlei TaxID=71964 RepID=A0ACC0TRE6_9AGAM|nr:histidine kinase-domain-containing protein [Russula earlei]